jgi:hypothetical protein
MPRRATKIKRKLSGRSAAIALIGGLLAAGAAYGAVWGLSGSAGHHRHNSPIAGVAEAKKRLPRPWITSHPKAQTSSTTATFRLSNRARGARLECHVDRFIWRSCDEIVTYASLEPERHRFFARAVRRRGGKNPIAYFDWTVEAPVTPVGASGLPFAIAEAGPPPLLYPGAGTSPLPLTLSNSNPDQIQVTSLAVAVTAGPAGCDPSVNIRVEPSPASSANPLVIPGNGTLAVSAAQAPTIELVETGMSQDACRGGSFSLSFSGSAHG